MTGLRVGDDSTTETNLTEQVARAIATARRDGFRAGIENTAKVLAAADDLSLAWNDHSRSEDNMGIEITALCAAITAFRALSPDAADHGDAR